MPGIFLMDDLYNAGIFPRVGLRNGERIIPGAIVYNQKFLILPTGEQ